MWLIKDDKHQVTSSAKKEDNTDLDKKGPISWNGYSDDTRMRIRHEDKRKNQVTTTAEKEDDKVSTATLTTAAVTSVCGSEWDHDTIGRLAETTTLNDQIYVFGKDDGWSLPASGEHPHLKSARKKNNPSST